MPWFCQVIQLCLTQVMYPVILLVRRAHMSVHVLTQILVCLPVMKTPPLK